MGNAKVEKKSEDLFAVAGDLDFESVPALALESQQLFRAGNRAFTVDLSAVERADSAALALLIQWLRNAEEQQQVLTLKNVPKNLISIAAVSNVDEFLPLM